MTDVAIDKRSIIKSYGVVCETPDSDYDSLCILTNRGNYACSISMQNDMIKNINNLYKSLEDIVLYTTNVIEQEKELNVLRQGL